MDHCEHASLIHPNRPNIFKCGLGKMGGQPDMGMCSTCEHFKSTAHVSRAQVIKNATSAIGRATKAVAGRKKLKVSKQEYDRRYAICKACPHFKKAQDTCSKCGCRGKYKTQLSSEKCPDGRWGFEIPAIISKQPVVEATTLVTTIVNNRLGEKLQEACEQWNINLRLQKADKSYKVKWKDDTNIMTWGVKMPPWWYARNTDKNILYMENGLFHQGDGCWIDDAGWFGDSSIVKDKEFEKPTLNMHVQRLIQITERAFKWEPFQGGDPDGPILYACQRNKDAPVQFHFTHKEKGLDSTGLALKLLSERTDRPVMVRPHPKFRGEFNNLYESTYKQFFKDNWTVNSEGSIYPILPKCSAVVTINSTVATEALILGIPVATLGAGAYTGSNATLECDKNIEALKQLNAWSPNQSVIWKYLNAVMNHQLAYSSTVEEILSNEYFTRWARRCHNV